MSTITAENYHIIKGEHIPGTPAENITQFEIAPQKVRAVFSNEAKAGEYFKKYGNGFSINWKGSIRNCEFTLNGHVIEAVSTKNTSGQLLLLFVNGLGSESQNSQDS